MRRFNDPYESIRRLQDMKSSLFSRLSFPNINYDLLSKINTPSIAEQLIDLNKISNISELTSTYEIINERINLLPEPQMLDAIEKIKAIQPRQSINLIEEMSRNNSVNELANSLSSKMSPLKELIASQKNILKNQNSKILESFSDSIRQTQKLKNSINLAYESIDKSIFSSFDNLQKIRIDYSDLWKSSSIISESIIRDYSAFNESNFAKYLNYIDDILEEDDDDKIDLLFDEFQNSFHKDRIDNKRKHINLDGGISILLTIFVFFYSLRSQNITDQKLDDILNQNDTDSHKIERLIEMQENLIGQLVSDNDIDDKQYYVISAIVNLRSKPDLNSEKIGILYPNQKVIVEKEDGEWLHVLYFNYLENITNTGWVYREYIEEIEDEI
jgi:Bacterial SH3 domain